MQDAIPIIGRLDAAGTTLAVAGPPGAIPAIVWFGPALPPGEDLDGLAAALSHPVVNAGLDEPVFPSLFPEAGRGHAGTPALSAFSIAADGRARRWSPRLAVTGLRSDGTSMTIDAADAGAGLGLTLVLALDPESGVLRATTRLQNCGVLPLAVDFLAAPALPVPRDDDRLLTFHGRWCGEFQERRAPWPRGGLVLESRTGRTGHEAFPGLVSLGPGTGERAGRALGVHLGWSGNWRVIAEEYGPGRRQILAGILGLPGEQILAPGAVLESPPLHAAATEDGMGALSARFHDVVRSMVALPRPQTPRPVHFNSWEAVYFDLSVPVLKELADAAAAVGAERFVVDDGWFAGRVNDRAGLGDWWVDPKKFPDGLGPVADHVRSLGLGFGLWVEPEMANPDSALLRAHPDWALAMTDRTPPLARHQLVLDVARPEVADHLFDRLDALLSAVSIDYLKWDMNRPLVDPARGGAPVAAEQVRAVHALMARLRKAHPQTEIESCSSGGGRIDYGMLPHVQRFWLSDNNDAHDRWRMNRAASTFFPPEIFGTTSARHRRTPRAARSPWPSAPIPPRSAGTWAWSSTCAPSTRATGRRWPPPSPSTSAGATFCTTADSSGWTASRATSPRSPSPPTAAASWRRPRSGRRSRPPPPRCSVSPASTPPPATVCASPKGRRCRSRGSGRRPRRCAGRRAGPRRAWP